MKLRTLQSMTLKVLFVVCAFGSASSLIAVTGNTQANAQAAKPKYAVLDMQAVILSVEEGRQARASLEKEIEAKKAELKKDHGELEKMRKEWESKQALLSEQARVKMQTEFQQKFMKLRQAEMKFEQEMKQKEGEATQKIAVKVAKLVQDYAKKQGFDAVFESNVSGMIYVRDPQNITSKVIEMYGKAKPGTTAKKDKK